MSIDSGERESIDRRRISVLRWAAFLLVFGALFAAFNFVVPFEVHDEPIHIRTINGFREMLLAQRPFSLDYEDSLGPVFYLSYAICSLPCACLVLLRLLSFLLCLVTVGMLCRWQKVTNREWIFFLAAVSAGPWFFLGAFSVHGEQLTMFLTVGAIWALTTSREAFGPRAGRAVLGAGLASLIPISRIYSIFILPALFLVEAGQRKRNFKTLFLLLAAGCPTLLLWAHWQGLTPPAFRHGSWGQGGQHLSFEMSWLLRVFQTYSYLGLYFLPFLFSQPRLVPKVYGKALVIAAAFSLIISLCFSLGIAGPLNSAISRAAFLRIGPQIPATELFWWIRPIYGLGLITFYVLVRLALEEQTRKDPLVQLSLVSIGVYSLLMPFTGILFVERYMYPMYLFVFLIGWKLTRSGPRPVWPFFPFILIGIAHAFSKQPGNIGINQDSSPPAIHVCEDPVRLRV